MTGAEPKRPRVIYLWDVTGEKLLSTAIDFVRVSKRFTLHHQRPRSFQDLVIQLFRRSNGPSEREPKFPERDRRSAHEEFWALRDVSFTIEGGQTVGIVGPNGAGKSTVLKLISRIIEPTSGEIEVNGRLGALLELGAGFHPDLSGRENVYLNGSILGLSRSEIDRRLDDIIAFAELERFIDMPVRHYSSGMYVRLGFSVAVHTDPEILLIDEVLAVGDAAFQRKCLEKIDELRRQGVTILFISHSADTVRNLCSRAIWLDEGHLVADGSAESVVAHYLDRSWSEGGSEPSLDSEDERRWGSGKVRITKVRLLGGEGKEQRYFQVGEPLTVEMHYQAEEEVDKPVFGLAIHRRDGLHITGPNTRFADQQILTVEGKGIVRYKIRSLPLLEGTYHLSVAAHDWTAAEMYDYHDRLYRFGVMCAGGERYGVVTLRGDWSWET
jgi:lipopolysaccharide transport system ATP-binding protein